MPVPGRTFSRKNSISLLWAGTVLSLLYLLIHPTSRCCHDPHFINEGPEAEGCELVLLTNGGNWIPTQSLCPDNQASYQKGVSPQTSISWSNRCTLSLALSGSDWRGWTGACWMLEPAWARQQEAKCLCPREILSGHWLTHRGKSWMKSRWVQWWHL